MNNQEKPLPKQGLADANHVHTEPVDLTAEDPVPSLFHCPAGPGGWGCSGTSSQEHFQGTVTLLARKQLLQMEEFGCRTAKTVGQV